MFAVDGEYRNSLVIDFYGDASSLSSPGGTPPFSIVSQPESRGVVGGPIAWDIPTDEVWQLGEARVSADLTPIISAIVSHANWQSGRALGLIAKVARTNMPPGAHRRVIAFEREDNIDHTARLVIRTTTTTPCFSVTAYPEPLGAGNSVQITTPPNCGNGTGWRQGTTISLTATPNPNNAYSFSRWVGASFASSDTALTTSLVVNTNLIVRATFAQKPPMVLVHEFQGADSVGFNCSDGVGRYAENRESDDRRYGSIFRPLSGFLNTNYDVWIAHWNTGGIPGTDTFKANGACLASQVAQVYAATGSNKKVTLVAHSMGGLLLPTEGENDGLIGRKSAVGYDLLARDLVWTYFSPPTRLWTYEAHIDDWANREIEVSVPESYMTDVANRLDPSSSYYCLRWLDTRWLGTVRPPVCDDNTSRFARLGRVGLAQASLPASGQMTTVFSGTLTAGAVVTETVPVDASGQAVFYLGWSGDTPDFRLVQPDGLVIDPAYAQANSEVVSYTRTLTPTEWTPAMTVYTVNNAQSGDWQLRVAAPSAASGDISYHSGVVFGSARTLAVITGASLYRPGETAVLQAELNSASGPITGASVVARIQRAAGSEDTLAFVEQGDGVYSASYLVPDEPGLQLATVTASGVDGGVGFSRQAVVFIPVARQTVALTGEYSEQATDTDGNGRFETLSIQVGLNTLAAGRYTVAGALALGEQVVASAAVPVELESGATVVTLTFNGDALRRAGLSGPYTLTQVQVRDPNAADLPVVSADDVYTTGAYGWQEFGTCYSVRYRVNPADTGDVTINTPPDCVSALGEQFSAGTVITVTAVPANGYVFAGWGNDGAGSAKTMTLEMDSNKDLLAFFAAAQKLRLTSMCSPNPSAYRVWRVRNSNPEPLAFTWDVYGTSQRGQGVAPAAQGSTSGEVFFQTQTVAGANTTRIFVNGILQDTKASTTAQCP